MKFSFRAIDTATICVLSGVVLSIGVAQEFNRQFNACYFPQPGSGRTKTGTVVVDRVVTREFQLVDDNGQTRARIGLNELNAPAISLYDKNDHERGTLRLNQNDVPSLRLFDATGTLRTGMGFAKGTLDSHLWFYDQDGVNNEMIPPSGVSKLNFLSPPCNYTTGRVIDNVILWNARSVDGQILPEQTEIHITVQLGK